jgi:alkyl hydroperoxide reductase subunit AhpF
MQKESLDILRKNLQGLPAKVEIIFQEGEHSFFSQALKEFAQAVSEAAEKKVIVTEKQGTFSLPGLPALTLCREHFCNIHYLALPEGYELNPFIQAIKILAQDYVRFSVKVKETITKVITPVDIRVFVSPYCTNCPRVVETVIKLAFANPLVSAFIIDVHNFKELADEYHLKSVPATVVNKEFVLFGSITEEKLAELLVQKDTPLYDRELMRSFIESGLTSKAADLICHKKGREVILELFREGDFFIRLGILVTFEEALEKDPESIRGMLPQLIELLSHQDHRIRGDIADLLGKIGDPNAIPHLQKLTSDPHPEVAEASTEALERLRNASG